MSVAAGRQNHRGLASRKENPKGKIPQDTKLVKMAGAFFFQPPQFCGLSFSLYEFPCCVGKGLEMTNGREEERNCAVDGLERRERQKERRASRWKTRSACCHRSCVSAQKLLLLLRLCFFSSLFPEGRVLPREVLSLAGRDGPTC